MNHRLISAEEKAKNRQLRDQRNNVTKWAKRRAAVLKECTTMSGLMLIATGEVTSEETYDLYNGHLRRARNVAAKVKRLSEYVRADRAPGLPENDKKQIARPTRQLRRDRCGGSPCRFSGPRFAVKRLPISGRVADGRQIADLEPHEKPFLSMQDRFVLLRNDKFLRSCCRYRALEYALTLLWSMESAKELLGQRHDAGAYTDEEVDSFNWATDFEAVFLDEVEAEIVRGGPEGKTPLPGFQFTPGQRLWYYKEAWKKGLFRFQEYPSILSECFRAPIEGAIYAALLDKARSEGRIGAIEVDPNAVVHTCWDLGGPLNIVTWYFQMIGDELRVIDCDTGLDLTPWARVEHMRMKAAAGGWTFGNHFLPHDAAAKDHKGQTIEAQLVAAGLANLRIVPQTADVWIGINHLRGMLPRMTFRAPACEVGLNSLEAYHVGVWIEKGRQMDLPVHDKSSHAADGLRTMAEADLAGMLTGGWVRSPFDAAGLRALRGAVAE